MPAPIPLDGETTVVGVIGWPVHHSLSPPMHNAAFAELGLNWVYVPFEVETPRLPAALMGVRALGLAGINVTVPHKEGVARLMDEVDAGAGALGVVNTVVNRGGRLLGFSTDGEGFLRSLAEAGAEVAGRRVVLIGAGGSARAVAFALAQANAAELTLINRTLSRAEDVCELVRKHAAGSVRALALDAPEAEAAVGQAEVVVDSTPTGMHPESNVSPVIPAEWLHSGQWVCDLVYTPRETVLLKAARSRGARTVDGTGMLVHQGAIAFEHWTGEAAPVETMRRALLEALKRRES